MNIKKVVAIGLLALVPAAAMSLPITSLLTNTTGPLRHNVFHDATGGGGAGGAVLAWFVLDTSQSSTWDPVTGALNLYVNIFDDEFGTTMLGTGHATSGNFFGSGFNGFDDISLGLINWAFSGAGAVSALGAGTTMDFIDHNYVTDPEGHLANSYAGNLVTLWGADGTHNGNGYFSNADLGVDMVFAVPEPAVILLMAMGLLGIGATVRRR